MKNFVLRLFVFSIPFWMSIPIELSVRENTYKAKSEYIDKNKDDIELLILGSSQINKGLNPVDLDLLTAPLSNDGSTLNIDYLLFERYFSELPELKCVIFEISYHSLEDRKGNNWNKNHLFYHYYKVNNYGKKPSLSEHFLVSSNPKLYLMRYFTPLSNLEDSKYNELGFVLNSTSRFGKYDYDIEKIEETSMKEYMNRRHTAINMDNYQSNSKLIDEAIKTCIKNNVKVVLVSPPKHYLYNNQMVAEKLIRRNDFFDKYKDVQDVYILNYEEAYEMKTELFLNEDHLNLEGSKIFTLELNERLKEVSQ